jgi:hypothetical protein
MAKSKPRSGRSRSEGDENAKASVQDAFTAVQRLGGRGGRPDPLAASSTREKISTPKSEPRLHASDSVLPKASEAASPNVAPLVEGVDTSPEMLVDRRIAMHLQNVQASVPGEVAKSNITWILILIGVLGAGAMGLLTLMDNRINSVREDIREAVSTLRSEVQLRFETLNRDQNRTDERVDRLEGRLPQPRS